MNRTEELMKKKGPELIAIADSYGLRINVNKERTQLKASKKAVVERIVAVELERAAEAAKKDKPKKRERKIYEVNGKAQTMSEWSKELGIPIYVFCDRLNRYNWTVERTFTTPLGKSKKRTAKSEEN